MKFIYFSIARFAEGLGRASYWTNQAAFRLGDWAMAKFDDLEDQW